MSKINCAIYVRKSTEKGLEQEFNSLNNQEEACKNYILSQSFNHWEYSKTYEDGGISGGTMKRPGLESLIRDIHSGKVQTVVVYKVDRLSRSIIDFHSMMKMFEEYNCNFVSITQSFDTSTSMGKLTLNMLLSFAQFEREVASERVRDKIASSKAKGMWMGGVPPLGYDNIEKKLIINEQEADKVRTIFNKYLELKSILGVMDYMNESNLFTKVYTRKNSGKTIGGVKWSGGRIQQVLKNQLYLGKTKHKDKVYEGLHYAIISEETFGKAQEIMRIKGNNTLGKRKIKRRMLLQNKVFYKNNLMKYACGKGLSYYKHESNYVRIDLLDDFVISTIERLIHSGENGLERSIQEELLYVDFENLSLYKKRKFIQKAVSKIDFENKQDLRLYLNINSFKNIDIYKKEERLKQTDLSFENIYQKEDQLILRLKFNPQKYKSKIKGILENKLASVELVDAISLGWKYRKQYEEGMTIKDISKKENKGHRSVYRHLNLSYLSPKIIEDVFEGKITTRLEDLVKTSASSNWKTQEEILNI